MSDKKTRFANIFIKNDKYPDVSKIFNQDYKTTDEVKDKCLFVLDTNVLLLPFETNQKDLDAIKSVFKKLIEDKRLIIPAQVAREFAENRGDKLKAIYDYLNSRPQINIPQIDFKLNEFSPLLKLYKEYSNIKDIEDKIKKVISNDLKKLSSEYTSNLNKLKEIAENWRWNDPVSSMYKELFSSDVIIEINDFDKRKIDIEKEHKLRLEHGIPPAFKDIDKEDFGIGDYLIWLTIMQISNKDNIMKDVVFVSQETKNDWIEKSNNTLLYPRYELCYEFANHTNGKSFNIITLSKLLKMFDVDNQVVENIKQQELNILQRRDSFVEFGRAAEQYVYNWLLKTYKESEIKLNREFPDYTIKHFEHKIGVEVKATKNEANVLLHFRHTFESIKFKTLRFQGFTELYLFLVVNFNISNNESLLFRLRAFLLEKRKDFPVEIYIGNMMTNEIIKL